MNARVVIVLAGVGALLLLVVRRDRENGFIPPDDETILDTIGQTMDQAIGSIAPGPAAGMRASDQLREMLKGRERLRLERYNLGDGGWTIGYGHWESSIDRVPARITVDDAEAMFDRDLDARAEKWVRLYVKVPVTQYEYDALVHIAFNLSPKGFKKFADAVNRGEGIGGIATQSVSWVAAHLRNGISNRRNQEIALFNEGYYA
jgi:lysozyme